MVRNYIKKGTRTKWNEQTMEKAIHAVKKGLAFLAASRTFKIPFTTLYRRFQRQKYTNMGMIDRLPKRYQSGQGIGHPKVLSTELEKSFADRIKCLDKRGFGLTQKDVRIAALKFAVEKKVSHPWKSMAGQDWCMSFCKRYNILLRKAEGFSKARATALKKKTVQQYFVVLKELLTNLSLHDKPALVYSMNETRFPVKNIPIKIKKEEDPEQVLVLTRTEKEEVTIVACCNAIGSYIPPLIIFKGEIIKSEFLNEGSAEVISCTSDNGWINEDIFINWLRIFQENRVPGKVLLIMDEHLSHFSLTAYGFCEENDIEVLCLPSHTIHMLQPLDRCIFKKLKSKYLEIETKWQDRNPTITMSQNNFNEMFCEAWKTTASNDLAVFGFSCTGIYPFNPNAIQGWQFAPSDDLKESVFEWV